MIIQVTLPALRYQSFQKQNYLKKQLLNDMSTSQQWEHTLKSSPHFPVALEARQELPKLPTPLTPGAVCWFHTLRPCPCPGLHLLVSLLTSRGSEAALLQIFAHSGGRNTVHGPQGQAAPCLSVSFNSSPFAPSHISSPSGLQGFELAGHSSWGAFEDSWRLADKDKNGKCLPGHLSPSAAHFLSMPKCSFHYLVPGKLAVTRH